MTNRFPGLFHSFTDVPDFDKTPDDAITGPTAVRTSHSHGPSPFLRAFNLDESVGAVGWIDSPVTVADLIDDDIGAKLPSGFVPRVVATAWANALYDIDRLVVINRFQPSWSRKLTPRDLHLRTFALQNARKRFAQVRDVLKNHRYFIDSDL